jgi:hypothetical protein
VPGAEVSEATPDLTESFSDFAPIEIGVVEDGALPGSIAGADWSN